MPKFSTFIFQTQGVIETYSKLHIDNNNGEEKVGK